ncbi:hypothetical protein [Flavobacterium sp. JP2137]|uniref:hypothetical protein n=1 Tax=Flavobacterium sp. JP2137 TaxID=3414510 RepID=UPI003D2FCDE2
MSIYSIQDEDFIAEMAVVCPKCQAMAAVFGGQAAATAAENEAQLRFFCVSCNFALRYKNTPKFKAHSKAGRGKDGVVEANLVCDPFFGFDLWYCTDTAYGLLWAYNRDHLRAIQYEIEQLRLAQHQNTQGGTALPLWAQNPKNSDYLIQVLEKLVLK